MQFSLFSTMGLPIVFRKHCVCISDALSQLMHVSLHSFAAQTCIILLMLRINGVVDFLGM